MPATPTITATHERTPAVVEITPGARDEVSSIYGEQWRCGACGRPFGDCTSCCAHEQQCGGRLLAC